MPQSIAPEWHPPEPGLEVVQPLPAEKTIVRKKGRVWNRIFRIQKTWALRRRTLYWIILSALLLVLAVASAVAVGLALKPHAVNISSHSRRESLGNYLIRVW